MSNATATGRRVWRCGLCNTLCRSIWMPGGLCMSCEHQPTLFSLPDPELDGSAVYRTARKPWRCQCNGSCSTSTGPRRSPCGNPRCVDTIAPGDRYVEYLGETPAHRSGIRYCLPCGVAAWTASKGDR